MHLVEAAGRRILLDCGLFLGNRSELRERNRQFPFDPAHLDAVILSHAHVDHCGNLPNLVRQGFAGPIYCTPATRDLLAVMLADAAKIQEEDAPITPVLATPLYTHSDTDETLRHCVAVPYGRPVELGSHLQFCLSDAGHLLGSAMIALRVAQDGREYNITFTGDLGRPGLPFLHPPAAIPPADLLICESTYGGKTHQPLAELAAQLMEIIERTLDRGGKVLIPAFSLGRAQSVVHFLQKWIAAGLLPRVPIYVDSPLVADIVEVHRRHPHLLAEDSQAILHPADSDNPASLVRYVRSWQESRELGESREPSVVVASGGMLDAGRALFHLRQYIDDPRCSVVLVSYQAPQSLGHRLLQRGPTVFFLGKVWNKWADVVALSGFSGHADHDDFLRSLTPLAGHTAQVKLVHGEIDRADALAQALRARGFTDVGIPERDETALVA
jgi:metallo-beta-lactamase family protein